MMRIWHKDLIPVLPRKQLMSQWRELYVGAEELHNGKYNHLLCNKVKRYPLGHYAGYSGLVWVECSRRGIRRDLSDVLRWLPADAVWDMSEASLFKGWHNDRYLRQCLYNLEERAMCGAIDPQEWDKVVKRFGNRFDLWKGWW